MALVRLQNVGYSLSSTPLLHNANLIIQPQERIALVGRNGAGKSTLLRILTGEIVPDTGTVTLKPDLKISMLQQAVPTRDSRQTVFDCVAAGLPKLSNALHQWHHAQAAVSHSSSDAALRALEAAQSEMDAIGGWSYKARVDTILSQFNLAGDRWMDTLSGGFTRRVLLAKALVSDPDLLLLDEPTNHLDIPTIEWLEDQVKTIRSCILLVSHDRRFIQHTATRILDLDRGELSSWPGDYHNYQRRKEEQLNAQALAAERLSKKLDKEEAWIRQGIKARRTRNEGRVRALIQLRRENQALIKVTGAIDIDAHSAPQSGKVVIDVDKLCYPLLNIQDFSYKLMRGDKVGILGPNGIGKTTLINLLLKKLEPESGTIHHGTRINAATLDQLRSNLDPNQTVRDYVGQGSDQVVTNGRSRHVMSWLKDFLFSSQQANTKLGQLSGGESARAMLARILSTDTNLLILDEPTNDLDVETLEVLEAWLVNYTGTLLLVSHDRDFLNNTVTRLLAFTQNGHITKFTGGYDDWEQYHAQRIAHQNSDERCAPSEAKDVPLSPTPKKRAKKLSFNEQRELEQLPAAIEALETAIDHLGQQLSDPNFYKEQPDQVAAATAMLEQKQTELEKGYERWQVLEAHSGH